jgi:hypothetical protein
MKPNMDQQTETTMLEGTIVKYEGAHTLESEE